MINHERKGIIMKENKKKIAGTMALMAVLVTGVVGGGMAKFL